VVGVIHPLTGVALVILRIVSVLPTCAARLGFHQVHQRRKTKG
jgi:hypothetical protein